MNGPAARSGARLAWVGLMLLILVVGVALGLVLGHGHHRHGRGGMGEYRARFMEHLRSELSLTPQQSQAVDSIFREQSSRVMRVRRQMQRELAGAEDTLNTSLARVLSPQQMDKLRTLRLRHRGGPGPGFLWRLRHDWGSPHEPGAVRGGAPPDSR